LADLDKQPSLCDLHQVWLLSVFFEAHRQPTKRAVADGALWMCGSLCAYSLLRDVVSAFRRCGGLWQDHIKFFFQVRIQLHLITYNRSGGRSIKSLGHWILEEQQAL
jgi:hypothetical protein